MENNTLLPLALAYLSKGYSVIPVGFDKIPLISWKPFQFRKANPEELVQWFTNFPDAQVGIVCGQISNLTVVDFETNADFNLIKDETYTVETGSKGIHKYFEYPTMCCFVGDRNTLYQARNQRRTERMIRCMAATHRCFSMWIEHPVYRASVKNLARNSTGFRLTMMAN